MLFNLACMNRPILRRLFVVCAFLSVVAGISVGVWRYGYLQALDQLSRQGEVDLALASDRLVGQLELYREFSVLIADHPVVETLAEGGDPQEASALFLEVADFTGALDIMFVNAQGVLKAAARTTPGRDLSGVEYIERAAHGALGWGHGHNLPLEDRAFYHAAPVFSRSGSILGAVIVAAGITGIEDEWRGGFRPIFFTDQSGEVFVTNRSELVSWRRPQGAPGLVPSEGAAPAFDSYQTGDHEVWQLNWGPYLPQNALHLVKELPIIDLKGEALVDVSPALRLARLQALSVAALCLAFGAVLFLATERRRALALANAQLEVRVDQRTRALSETNTALRREISERQEAQAALARAQDDLVQASKLSALGQMSAGISHELNQPLMAINSFADNAATFLDRGQPDKASQNLTRIAEMARRMGRIIKNLRAFSKQQAEPMTRVDLTAVLREAIEMVEERAAQMQARILCDLPEEPLWVQGGEVRLGQVFVNLLTNALDAMNNTQERVIQITIPDTEVVEVWVQDTGTGVDVPEKVFDPFYSTKEVGASEGMGLGLSISYGIVRGFGGDIRVRNCNPGARFIVELQRWHVQEAA